MLATQGFVFDGIGRNCVDIIRWPDQIDSTLYFQSTNAINVHNGRKMARIEHRKAVAFHHDNASLYASLMTRQKLSELEDVFAICRTLLNKTVTSIEACENLQIFAQKIFTGLY